MSHGNFTEKAKSWGNGPMWAYLNVCTRTSSSNSTQLNLQQMFARNIPLRKGQCKSEGHHTCAIGTMVAVDLRPYSIVEKEGLRELLQILEPRYSMVSRKDLTKTVVHEIYSELKEKDLSESHVNFTTDMWKCEGQNREYTRVMAHWAVEDPEKIFHNKECSSEGRRIFRQSTRVQGLSQIALRLDKICFQRF